ncbi:MAG: sugar nucleotide-binding protein, partial [Actinomycetota bacterium]
SVHAHLVHVSTDYVFSGLLDRPHTEQDVPDPLSAYGRSKLAGERAALASLPTATVARTSWLCGEYGPNMVKTILRLAGGDAPLRFVDDQRGCPTFTADLAPLLRLLAVTRVPGIVHATNQGAMSWYEFARSVLAADGHDPDRVTPVSTSDLQPPRPAPRPTNSVLANIVLSTVGIPLLRPFGEPLHELVARLRRSQR